MAEIAVRNLSFSYPEHEKKALNGITLSVKEGEFLALCGLSGSGKSTLLRQLKSVLAPHGEKSGEILVDGKPLDQIPLREQTEKIGFVMQNPENQIVTDKVWHELAFGLESLGLPTADIRRRVSEMASFFGIQDWFYQNVKELSGGQKQILNLASVMAMQPDILLLDEPTSQLDPIAASEFIASVEKINRELGVTVLMADHRLEEILPLCSRAVVLDKGSLLCDGTPRETGEILRELRHPMFLEMPTPVRVHASVQSGLACPLTVREGRQWLREYAGSNGLVPVCRPLQEEREKARPAVSVKDAWFRYEKDGPDVLKGLSFAVYPGELFAVLGGNGTGKTTALSVIGGLLAPYRGEVEILKTPAGEQKAAFLPQNPQALFVKKSVKEDLLDILKGENFTGQEEANSLLQVSKLCRITDLLERHPRDLSGGELQRAALAKVLLLKPQVLLLDEPTKGVDGAFKRELAGILKSLNRCGVAVLMVSHDVEFCARYADRCALFFDGGITAEGTPHSFFTQNSFYTTAANRMARGIVKDAVTAEDILYACGKPSVEEEKDAELYGIDESFFAERELILPQCDQEQKLPVWRKAAACLSALSALGAFVFVLRSVNLTEIVKNENVFGAVANYKIVYGVLIVSLFILAFSVSRREPAGLERRTRSRQKLTKRTVAAMAMILLAIPLTILAGIYYLDDRKYYFISLLVVLETMLPFILVFESRRPQAREIVILAVLCAIGVAGRAAFAVLPGFKPVIAVVILAGVAFGGEAGFLVGAVTMLVSNMLFGQGPWTPWQMFAMGLIGFLAGILFQKGVLGKGRAPLAVFGAIAAIFLYGGIMNPAMVFIYQPQPVWEMFAAAYITGFPLDLVQAAAAFLFLWFLADPFLEKLERVKVKYGLIQKQ